MLPPQSEYAKQTYRLAVRDQPSMNQAVSPRWVLRRQSAHPFQDPRILCRHAMDVVEHHPRYRHQVAAPAKRYTASFGLASCVHPRCYTYHFFATISRPDHLDFQVAFSVVSCKAINTTTRAPVTDANCSPIRSVPSSNCAQRASSRLIQLHLQLVIRISRSNLLRSCLLPRRVESRTVPFHVFSSCSNPEFAIVGLNSSHSTSFDLIPLHPASPRSIDASCCKILRNIAARCILLHPAAGICVILSASSGIEGMSGS